MAATLAPPERVESLVNMARPDEAADLVARLNDRLARTRRPGADVVEGVRGLITSLRQTDLGAWEETDPFLVGVCVKALAELSEGAIEGDRRLLRIGLARLEHALRELAERRPFAPDRSAKDVVRWVVDRAHVSQRELVDLAGVPERTFQRWASAKERAAPGDDEDARIRVIAAAIAGLQHVFTPTGAIRWFDWPSPFLAGATPRSLLPHAEAHGRILRAVNATRAGDAA